MNIGRGAGDVQWMTAGGGIIHQEMPELRPEALRGFQLWVNLPSGQKMMSPRYRDIRSGDIPEVSSLSGATIKVIAGRYRGVVGPARDIVIEPSYLDVTLPKGGLFEEDVPSGNTVFAHVVSGLGLFGPGGQAVSSGNAVLFRDGTRLQIGAGEEGLRFLVVSGRPLGEPVAWRGPIVMNTQDELDRAFEDYRNGTFLRP
ncbi:MAG: pirin family protein [Candidatus Aminicenantes bacterium]|nr:pirin family protein [Candidatus Aminicenantes bacterium]